MAARTWSDESRTLLICADSYEHSILQGRFYNSFLQKGECFESLSQLITKIEQTLDGMEYPKPYTIIRTFSPTRQKPQVPSGTVYQNGKLASFSVKILFRQNASWQGSVTWIDTNQEQSFRSTLELILLFDSALSQPQAK